MLDMCEIRRSQTVKLGIVARRRIAQAKDGNLCVACLQPLYGRSVRGCHHKCYRGTLRAIEKGLTTELERVMQGKLLPCAKSGPRPSNAVIVQVMQEQADES
jgi:hypothetical protein